MSDQWMAANVVLRHADGTLHTFLRGTPRQDVPEWARDKITNPKVWTDVQPAPEPARSGPCGFCGAHVPPVRPYTRIDGKLVCNDCADRLQPAYAAVRAAARQVCLDADAGPLIAEALGDCHHIGCDRLAGASGMCDRHTAVIRLVGEGWTRADAEAAIPEDYTEGDPQ